MRFVPIKAKPLMTQANIIEGDPTNLKTLLSANIAKASWVVTLSESDGRKYLYFTDYPRMF